MRPWTSSPLNHPVPARRSRTRQRRHVLAFLALALSTVAATHAAFAIQPPPTPDDFSAPAAHNLLSQVHFPVIEPNLRLLPVSIEPHLPRKELRAARADWITCGWGVTNPAGHFGDYEYAGLLVPAWIEFFDEANLREIFHTLAGVADGPDSSAFAYYEMEDPQMELADYRHASGFSPELLVEFVGGTDLRIEVNFTQGRMLVQVDARWDFYHLNQSQAGLLREIIAAGKNNPPAT